VLRDEQAPRIAFVTYYKGEYGLHTLEPQGAGDHGRLRRLRRARARSSTSRRRSPHTLVAGQREGRGRFEKMFLEGRPPVNVGVTSGGDVFGGTQVTFSDVLGDQQFNMFAASSRSTARCRSRT
jgi:hypothetical protein